MSELALVEQSHAIDVQHWSDVLMFAGRFADAVSETEFVPTALRGRPDAVAALVVYGAEVGITPMQALAGIHIVEGRPQPSAELCRAMILRAGHTFVVHDASGTRARVSGLRRGRPESERVVVEWTLDMARAAGLLGRPPWQRYPRAMLLARATGELARLLFADVVKGLGYIAEDDPAELDAWHADGADTMPETPARKPLQRRSRARKAPAEVEVPALAPEPSESKSERPPVAPEPLPPEVDDNTTDRWLTDEEALADEATRAEQARAAVEEALSTPPRGYDDDDQPLPDDMQPVGTGRPMRVLPDPEPEQPDDEPPPRNAPPVTIGARPLRALHAGLGRELGTSATRDEKHLLVEAILGHPITSTKELSRADGYRVLDYLDRFADGSASWEFVDGGERIVVYGPAEPGED